MQARSFATLLLDLLTEDEEEADAHSGHLRFDIQLLADRLVAAVAWIETQPTLAGLPVGYFGASTGAAAALVAAARRPAGVGAVVSRGGRPDLAGEALASVETPTLLIVGGRDDVVIDLNRQAYDRMHVERHLVLVPGATHLFEEPGTLEEAARLAGDWFTEHLAPTEAARHSR